MRNSSHRKELGLCMRRVDYFIVTLILLALVIFPNDLAIGENNKPVIISSGKYGKGYRYNVQGWVYIHIEGEPYERGYQYGYLASAEIVDMIHHPVQSLYLPETYSVIFF